MSRRRAARIACLVLLCAAQPSWAQDKSAAPPAGVVRQAGILQRTVATALQFLEPRILEPIPIRQLTLWGLRGLTAVDPDLAVEADDAAVSLLQFGRAVQVQPAPRGGAEAWAGLVDTLARAAAELSEPVRSSGVPGVTQAFFDELFNHLDPYSRYVAPPAADVDRARRNGTASPGLTLARRGPDWVVASVAPNGSAADAGLQVGDRVLELDSQALRGLAAGAVADLLTGPEGTSLSVVAQPRAAGGGAAAGEYVLERSAVPPETVFASRDGQALVLRVTGFNRATESSLGRELSKFIRDIGPGRPRSLVLDLRGNRGGLLRQAASAAALLVRSGTVAATAGRNPSARHLFRAEGGDILDGRPVVVLVDGRTASSAEILAAALGDLRRAVVVGSSTLGKGLVQTVATLPDGGELFVTWSRVLAPGGWPLQGLGVLPQICTSRGAPALDEQLRALAAGKLDAAQALAAHHAARAPLSSGTQVELRSACRAAEGNDLDLRAARFLLANPQAYQAALIGPFEAASP